MFSFPSFLLSLFSSLYFSSSFIIFFLSLFSSTLFPYPSLLPILFIFFSIYFSLSYFFLFSFLKIFNLFCTSIFLFSSFSFHHLVFQLSSTYILFLPTLLLALSSFLKSSINFVIFFFFYSPPLRSLNILSYFTSIFLFSSVYFLSFSFPIFSSP